MSPGIQAIGGPVLNPSPTGGVEYWPDGVLVGDDRGRLVAAGPWEEVAPRLGLAAEEVPRSAGLILPPLLDAHKLRARPLPATPGHTRPPPVICLRPSTLLLPLLPMQAWYMLRSHQHQSRALPPASRCWALARRRWRSWHPSTP